MKRKKILFLQIFPFFRSLSPLQKEENGVEYYKVNSYSISEVEIDTYDGLKYYYNGKLIDDVMMSYGVDKAVQEYIEENY